MPGLATRCSACGTVFRVVPDQLRVSEGWVRCGRCAEVFNAAEALIDLDSGERTRLVEAPAVTAPVTAAAVPAPAPAPVPMSDGTDFELQVTAPPAPAAPPAAPAMAHDDVPAAAEPAWSAEPEPGPGAAGPRADLPEITLDPPAAAVPPTAAADDSAPRAEPDDRPSFVRQAERAARWQQPRVRAALAVVALLALLGLAAQVLYEYRDLAAARYAGLRPPLEQACQALGCRVGDAHAIDALAVESSGLLRVEKSNIYKLTVSLRNRAGIAVALPALDLTLTDAQGQVLARRVLRAAELGVNGATLAAGRELPMQATLQAPFAAASQAGVAGYTIELFYP